MIAMSAFKRAGTGPLTPVARVLASKLLSGAASALPPALLLALSLFATNAFAISGTKNIPGDYATLAAAITDLNTNGVDAPGVTLNLLAGNAQTAPLGGYAITTLTGSATTPIVIQGNGNTITAAAGQVVGNLNDAIFKIIGSDYVTLTGFMMTENVANTATTAASNNMTEWGVALLYATATDNSQNITIQNNTIDLDRTYQNTFGIYANATHTAAAVTTPATATGAAGGNNNLKIYGNTITDVNIGMVVIGPTAAADQNDGLDIGGTTSPTGNTITNFGTTPTFSSYANVSGTVNGILVRNNKNYNVSRNAINSSNGGMTASGTMNGIQVVASSNAPTGTLTQTVNDNTISLRPGVAGATINAINLAGTTSVNATTTNSVNNNNFNTFGHTVAGTGAINFVIQSGNPLTQNINGNTFTNISLNTTNTVTFFSFGQNVISGGSLSISGNQVITGFTRTGVGATTVWSSNGSSVNGSTHAINNNIFSNILLTGASAFSGILDTDGASGSNGPVKSVNGNVFTNITTGAGTVVPISVNFSGANSAASNNTISGITTGNSIAAILLGASNQATFTAAGNTIGNISSGGTSVVGISTGALTAALSKNRIHDLNGTVAGSVVTGIAVTNSAAGASVTVVNNLVGNLTAPIATSSNGVIGVNITGSATTSNYNLFYNTIYLNNATSGAGFGSSGISAAAATIATTSALNLRNNIVVNTSVQSGAGLTVAYRRSVGTANALANYASASNNNDFYAGTPSASNLIYFDGASSAQTIAAYKAGVFTAGTIGPRDSASISENPAFVSTTGTNANFLHINTATPTQLEGGGTPVSGVTDDFDGNTRNATTPDIGADEFAGILLDLVPPTISYTALANTNSTSNRSLSSTITDATGVPTAGVGLPVLYYRKGATDPYVAAQGVSAGGSTYSFTINYALVNGGSVTTGDVIQYYIVAQDTVVPTPNVGSNPSAGAAGFTASPPTAATPPTTPSSYAIVGTLSGTKTVGAGGDYATLTSANGLFADINGKVITGNLTVNVVGDLIEDGTTALDQWAEDGAGNYTLTIQSNSSTLRTISGAVAAGMIRLNGADRVTFDGRVGGTGQYLLFRNTSTAGPTFTFLNDATNNTIESSLVEGATTSATVGTILFGTSTGTLGNSGNKIQFSDIRDRSDAAGVPANAVFSAGSAGAPNAANMIAVCNVFNWTNAGVLVSATGAGNGWTINPSSFYQTAARTTPMTAISIQGGSGHSILGNFIGGTAALAGGSNLATNQVFRGIDLLVGTASPTSVQGNVVKNIRSSLAGSFTASYGIFLQAGTANIGNVTGNTVGSSNVAERYEISGDSYGMRVISTSTANVSNNVVNNFTTAAGVPTGEFYFGMSIEGAAGIHSVINNTITNVTNGSTPDATFDTQTIGLNVQATGVQTIRGNTISNIGSASITAPPAKNNRVWGMITSGTAVGSVVEKNTIANIYAASAGAAARVDIITGLQSQTLANATYSNNMVSSTGSSDGVTASDRAIFGILDLSAAPSVSNYFFNSVSISGTATAANSTYAFNRNSTATTTLRNNIFADTRSGGTGFHVAMANTNPAATGWNATASNYNLLFNAVPANLTQWLGAAAINNQTLAGFQTATGGDANSLSADPLFVSASNLHLQVPPALSPAESAGTPFGSVTTDIDNDFRPATKPDIGADELVSNLTISPATVAFGNQAVGTTSTELTVTLANTGAGSLDVTALTAVGAPFARTGTGTCSATLPITIAAGADCTLTYTFAPSSAGAASQTLTVTSNGPGSGTITLTGAGTQGNLTISPATVTFADQLVGSTSGGTTVTLANTGNATLTVTALDAALAPFEVAGSCGPAPFTILAGANCTLIYSFAPTAAVASSQTLAVTANAPGNDTITLTGTGIQGSLMISPASVDFGNQAVGSTSTAQTVTLANAGSAPLQVSVLTPATTPFALTGNTCGSVTFTIAAGANCTLTYTFTPTATGVASQTLTVTANAPGSGSIALSGTGVQGTLTISPAELTFGNQGVGSTSTERTVTLGNTGGAPLQVTVLTPAAAPFARSIGTCSGGTITIAANSSCTLTYTFAPTVAGAASQVLTVTANAPGSGTITLTGTGTQGALTITPAAVNFGTQTVNIPSTESTVTLANTGNASLDVTALTAATAPFARTAAGTCSPTLPIIIAAGANCTLTYQFTPTATGPASQTLTVTTDGTGSGTISLSGNGAGVGGVCPTGLPIEITASAGTPGPTGYGTLKAGFDAINNGIHQGALQMAVCGNTAETVSAVLNASGNGPSLYTALTISPANGGARTITGTLAAPLVDLNGADNVTIDGLNGGGNALTISNASTASTAGTSTIRFIEGATGNTVVRTSILGSSTGIVAAATGNVLFSTSTVAGGNSTNLIMANNIGPSSAGLPTKGVTSLGSTSPNNNVGNVIDANSIFDVFSPTASVAGISLQANTTTTTVSNNRIFQTAPRISTGSAVNYAGISATMGTGQGTASITGNVIGFGAADGTGTTTISGSTNSFTGISVSSASTTVASSIQNNTISGINQSTAGDAAVVFTGIFFSSGRYDVGTVAGNKVGSLDGSSTITLSLSSNGAVYVLRDGNAAAISNAISNNQIGAITISGTGAGTNGFRGILAGTSIAATTTISNNQIGGSGGGAITNTLVGGYAMYGIASSAGNVVATGNTIRNITANSNAATTIVISGIILSGTGTTGPNTVSQNTVHSLTNNAGTVGNSIYALYGSFPTTTANVVERNLVHSLLVNSTATTSQMVGIVAAAGNATYRNNMVRIGLDASGASITPGYVMYGIFEIAGTNNLYNNSLYVAGTGVASASNTFAFVSNVATGTRNYVDNIFWNARSNVSGAGKNYAIAVGGTAPNPSGLSSGYNDLLANGSGGFIGRFNAVDQLLLADWQTATGQDANSFSEDPKFIAPNGTAATVNLHINPSVATPVEGTGLAIASVTNDFDGDVRAGLTPTDVGADAGNFIAQVGNLTISPTAVLFGNVVVGATSTEETVTLGNSGTGSLRVTALSAASTPFARTATGTCSATLPITIVAGGSCTLTYTFSPTATGPASQTLTVTANAPGSGTIALSGTGIQGNLTITPATIAFGNVAVGSNSGPTAVSLANTGSAPLVITALTDATAPFSRVGGSCSAVPITIPAGGNCSVAYRFAPTATGAASQTLTVTANAPGSVTITLTGNGTQGALVINPTTVAFGNQAVGTTSTAQMVTLTNTGDASLNVTVLTAATSPFARLAGSCGTTAPFAIAAGTSCSLTYTFAPTAAGVASQTLTVTSDVTGSGTITLTGTGTQGALVISPTTLAFGNQSVGTTSTAQTVTLTNSGDASLNVTVLTAATSPFARSAGSCGTASFAIAAGASCTLTYTFAPNAAGAASQTLTVTSNAPGSGTITLTGTGVQGNLVISPTTVDFGSPDILTTTAFKSVTLSNTGVGSLQVTSITLAAAPFARTADGSCGNSLPITIAAGASCTITYTFAPTTAGPQSQTFNVSTTSPGSGSFTLTGTGVSDRIFMNGFDS